MTGDLIERMRREPQGGWTLQDVNSLCDHYGIGCEPPQDGQSHHKISLPNGSSTLTIPAGRPIKPVYIKAVVGLVASFIRQTG